MWLLKGTKINSFVVLKARNLKSVSLGQRQGVSRLCSLWKLWGESDPCFCPAHFPRGMRAGQERGGRGDGPLKDGSAASLCTRVYVHMYVSWPDPQ